MSNIIVLFLLGALTIIILVQTALTLDCYRLCGSNVEDSTAKTTYSAFMLVISIGILAFIGYRFYQDSKDEPKTSEPKSV